MLELDDVTKIYPAEPPVIALDGVSFSVRRGELVAIVGPSGSGKSTLLHLMGTLDRPSSGAVRITGLDVAGSRDRELSALRATRIGFVFQQFFLAEHADRARERRRRAPLRRRRRPRSGARRPRARSRASGSRTAPAFRPTSSRAASASASRSPARSSASRRSCSPTSRPATSTAPTAPRSSPCSQELNAEGATIVVITHDRDLAARLPRQVEMLDGRIVTDSARTAGQRRAR